MEPQEFAKTVRRMALIGEEQSKQCEAAVVAALKAVNDRCSTGLDLAVHRSRAERRHMFVPGACFTNASPPSSASFGRDDFYTDERLNLARLSVVAFSPR